MRTAISDIEVDYIDIEQPIEIEVPGHKGKYPFGYLTHFAYKVKDSDEEIVVATTRLETMLGDVAVAVNSKDPRYTHLHGKKLVHPFIKDREVVVICDDELVDMNFGTGAVKVTPGHDPRDYDCGLRHNLPQITIFAEDGSINELGGPYAKMMRFDARIKMEEDMKNLGIYRKKEVNKMRLGICSRSKDIIEPMLKP
jgi:valyl-tRNA synthetase